MGYSPASVTKAYRSYMSAGLSWTYVSSRVRLAKAQHQGGMQSTRLSPTLLAAAAIGGESFAVSWSLVRNAHSLRVCKLQEGQSQA